MESSHVSDVAHSLEVVAGCNVSYMEIEYYIVAFFGGLFAGGLNSLAGNGSAITLTILTEIIGVPGNIANGTNRVGVFAQGIASTIGFLNKQSFNHKRDILPLLLLFIGAIGGFLLALNISNENFIKVFRYLMIALFFSLFIRPSQWLRKESETSLLPRWGQYIVFLLVGAYGGFIQMGMGILFLVVTVLGIKYSIMDANLLKSITISLYTIFGIALFSYYGFIHWEIGLIMAVGQFVGGYFTARKASGNPRARIWAYRLLIISMLLALVKMFFLLVSKNSIFTV